MRMLYENQKQLWTYAAFQFTISYWNLSVVTLFILNCFISRVTLPESDFLPIAATTWKQVLFTYVNFLVL